ncbi:hypothetical protein BV25DRAFT_1063010 [Artomyces pyxidatus]|uniref:Uncharacterized protein n=1 Tax=Artomyces pyxidatus TaxID=48021 RepID=A0ACB8SU59_9AGAM|nr:hypothetical protein BV25DRAFT_1063010 [Artomyces pyxidatus]
MLCEATPLAAEVCETLFFGLYTALFGFSTYLILYTRPPSRMQMVILTTTSVMYLVSTAHWATNTAVIIDFVRDPSADPNWYKTSGEQLVVMYIPAINYILSDAIVVWRAWVISEAGRNVFLFVPPLIFMVGTFVSTCVSAAFTLRSRVTGSARDDDVGYYLGLAVWALTILTNIWATTLIAIRAWKHRRFVESMLGKGAIHSRAEAALLMLIESGVLYVFIWVAYETTYFVSYNTSLIFDAAIVQIVGIYPTLIVVIVSLHASSADVISRLECSEHRASRSSPVFARRDQTPALAISISPDTDSDSVLDDLSRHLEARKPMQVIDIV